MLFLYKWGHRLLIKNMSHHKGVRLRQGSAAAAAATAAAVEETVSNHSSSKPVLYIAIPTFNRLQYVQLQSQALRWMKSAGYLEGARVEVYDDSSTEYTLDELRKMYGNAASMVTLAVNQDGRTHLGGDGNTFLMWRRFVECPSETCGDHLVVLDSDALLAPHWRARLFGDIEVAVEGSIGSALQDNDVIGLYNSGSGSHPVVEQRGALCLKRTFGSLGVLYHRRLATWLLAQGAQEDWDVVHLLSSRDDVEVMVACDSLVFHFGMGASSHGLASLLETSVGFALDDFPADVRASAKAFADPYPLLRKFALCDRSTACQGGLFGATGLVVLLVARIRISHIRTLLACCSRHTPLVQCLARV